MSAALATITSDEPFKVADALSCGPDMGTTGRWSILATGIVEVEDFNNLVESQARRYLRCYAADSFVPDLPTDLVPSFTQPLSLLTLCSETFTAEAPQKARRTGLGWSLALGVPLALGSSWAGYSHEVALQHLAAKTAELATGFVGPIEASHAELSIEQHIVLELQGLRDGWDGPDSLKPSSELIEDVKAFFAIVEVRPKGDPDVQVDEDGTVAMFWRAEPRRLFSVNFGGKGVVVVSYVSPVTSERFAERIVLRDGVAVLRALTRSKMAWAVARRA